MELDKAETKQDVEQIIFDNKGNVQHNNRKYRRDSKRLWASVTSGKKSLRYFTQKKNKHTKSKRKLERQNRKKGRK